MLQQSPTRSPGMTQDKTRLFFALVPDPLTRDTIYRATRGAVTTAGGRPTTPENLHITLAFLGPLPSELLELYQRAAEEVLAQPFTLVMEEIGYWPSAQVVWLGCADESPLQSLAQDLRHSLKSRSLPFDKQRFTPHMTLARWAQKASAAKSVTPVPWEVREFALVRSVTQRGGVEYTTLARWPLGRQGTLI